MSWAHPDWLSCTVDYFMKLVIMRKFDPKLLEQLFKSARGFDTNIAPKSVIITPCWLRCSAHTMSPHRYYSSSYILHSMFCFLFVFLLKVNRSVSCESLTVSLTASASASCRRVTDVLSALMIKDVTCWPLRSALLCSALSVWPLCLLITARFLFCRITSHHLLRFVIRQRLLEALGLRRPLVVVAGCHVGCPTWTGNGSASCHELLWTCITNVMTLK